MPHLPRLKRLWKHNGIEAEAHSTRLAPGWAMRSNGRFMGT